MPLFRPIQPPHASASPTECIDWAAQRDPIGHRVHLVLAIIALATIPLSSTAASISSTLLFGYTLLRAPTLWRTWRELPGNPVVLSILGLYAWLAISLAWSPDVEHGTRLLRGARFLLLIPALVPMLRHVRLLLAGVVVGILIQTGVQILETLIDPTERTGGLSEHPGNTGLWYSLALSATILLPLSRLKELSVRIPAAGVIFVGLFMTAARSAIAGGVLGTVAGTALCAIRAKRKLHQLILAAIVGVLILGSFIVGVQTVGDRFESSAAATSTEYDGGLWSKWRNRDLWWRIGFAAWQQEPIIGHGLGSVMTLVSNDPEVVSIAEQHPLNSHVFRGDLHSTFINLLAETGAVGLLLLLIWLVLLSRRILLSGTIAPVLLAGLIAYLVYSAVNTTLFSGRLVAFSSTLIALSLYRIPEASITLFRLSADDATPESRE